MAKRRTYEQKLLDDMLALPRNKWFNAVVDKSNKEFAKFVVTVKEFMYQGHPFEFTPDYKKVRRVCNLYFYVPIHTQTDLVGYRIELTEKGLQEDITIKGKTVTVDVPPHYRIWKGDKLIATEPIIKKKNGK